MEREKYARVNGAWPEEVPELTGPEAIAAAKRLYRFAMKRGWKGKWKLTSGRRYTWPRGGTFYVNPARSSWAGPGTGRDIGWRDLVHMMSHYCHQRLHPGWKPHGAEHHFQEKAMVEYVLAQGWLDGKLRPTEKPAKAPAVIKAEKVEASIKRWTTKLRRADRALRKLRRQKARYPSLSV